MGETGEIFLPFETCSVFETEGTVLILTISGDCVTETWGEAEFTCTTGAGFGSTTRSTGT